MTSGEIYTKNQIDKLGNTLIFLCEKIPNCSKTQLLKLIFIIEEIAVKKYGIPFFDLRFDVWKLGPVSKDLFVELSEEPILLSEYIGQERSDTNPSCTIIVAKKQFCDDEFSDLEINLLNDIIDRFRDCSANELINFTHREQSPWYKTALKHGVLDLLEKGKINTTEIEIDLSETIKGDEQKMALYEIHKDFITHSRSFKQ